jgi:hypothetical protein
MRSYHYKDQMDSIKARGQPGAGSTSVFVQVRSLLEAMVWVQVPW